MKAALMILFAFPVSMFAQNATFVAPDITGEYTVGKNDAENPCITETEYGIIEKRCAENVKLLNIDNGQQKQNLSTSLNWPVQAAAGFTDCSYYVISAYVDQNTATGVMSDWNCGTRTYDGHGGTDIAIWPFSFNKVDSSSVEVIAAAPGTIIDKHDGEFDRNCVGSGSGLQANYIIIQHADGSMALYWHMKQNSITSKAIGQTVVVGEHMGVVASSGSSSGPHLHFEVWAGSTGSTRIDPYYGTCNLLNASTWWASQKPVTEPAILKASVHITDYYAEACPNSDTTNESTFYVLPFNGPGMATDYAKFYIFFRDVTTGSIVDLKILNPNGTTYSTWNYTFPGTYMVGYWAWSKHLPILPGVCTFQATYNGVTCSQNFNIINSNGISENSELQDFQIFPNPSNSYITIGLPQTTKENTLTILNINGQELIRQEIIRQEIKGSKIQIDIRNLTSGVYFVKLINDKSVEVKKIIKE